MKARKQVKKQISRQEMIKFAKQVNTLGTWLIVIAVVLMVGLMGTLELEDYGVTSLSTLEYLGYGALSCLLGLLGRFLINKSFKYID